MKLKQFILLVVVAIMLTVSYGYSQENHTPIDELTNIAKKYLIAKNQLLVNGYSNIELESFPIMQSYRKDVHSGVEDILRHRDSLIIAGQHYSDFKTELMVKESKLSNKKVVLIASEYTKLELSKADRDPLAPKTTEYVKEHSFTFVYDKDGNWKLSSNILINNIPAELIHRRNDPIVLKPDEMIIDIESTVTDEYPVEVNSVIVSKNPILTENEYQVEGLRVPFSKSKVVRYAYIYWDNYNPRYREFFSNDCTNFVSQALWSGGWPYIEGFYTSPKVWWYKALMNSHTWAGAHNWFQFTKNSSRGTVTRNFKELEPGDILQIDYYKLKRMNHSMIVTKKDSSNTIYLTYHNYDYRDRSINDILQKYPLSDHAYYGWKLSNNVK